jgi:lipopolysaccharide transport system permease protein
MNAKRVYTAKSELANPLKLIKNIFYDLRNSRYLAWRLLARDISAKYRQTVTGYLSAILPPIVSAVIFIMLNQSNILNIPDTDIPYPAFVFTGTILWSIFTLSINTPLVELQTNRSLLVRIRFAKEALILTSFGQIFYNLFINMFVLLLILLFFSVNVSISWLLLVIPVIATILLGVFIGTIIVPISFLYQDIKQGINMLFSMVMYITPVAYVLPETGIITYLGRFNPMTYILNTFRDIIFGHEMDSINITLIVLICSFFLFIFSMIIFRIALPRIIERMDA